MTTAKNQTRLLALGLFVFLGTFAAIVWSLMRPYGTAYFFPVHFLIGAGLPFLIYAIGATRLWFWLGMVVTAGVLLWFNLWGHDLDGAAPRLLDWSHFAAGAVGMAGAFAVQLLYRRARPPHRPSIG
ncbi:hypothetical protein JWH11_02675 [Xanthomonas melonis]|uniref:DUF4175 domain-containing protein n=1 Tax=Xanthomonas melonis TaxID=56456 RepID=A0ABS8NQM4_9XANT|nr:MULTISPECIES: hypothetical protein [Xanthomonas]MCC4587902.1 hypothetical protein [Xanthomonas sp. NCPPB 1067]MCD0257097.1 hypothetical protein [Xanthomonas melonis]MCD0265359.1 hypothetical protein [Xanthomonas melonis]MCD0278398.1 hypothetical protein [Xanthomonas melonis]